MRRDLAEWAEQAHQLSERRAARRIPVHRATLRYQHHRDPQESAAGFECENWQAVGCATATAV